MVFGSRIIDLPLARRQLMKIMLATEQALSMSFLTADARDRGEAGSQDAAALLPAQLPESFDTAELAEAAAITRRLAQQMTYCLRTMGMLEISGSRRRAHLYRRTCAPARVSHRSRTENAPRKSEARLA